MDFDKITEYLESLTKKGIPSVDCIVMKNHEVLYRHMCGTIDADRKVSVDKDTAYLMFSMTKVQTMTAFMQLVEQGKISLEDEVGDYLPAYKNLFVKEENEVKKASKPLKIKYLLSMQSGLDYDLNRPGILRVLKEKGDKATTREIVDAFIETPLNFEPGEHFCYSLSHDVAAAIIEVVSGMKFGDYLKKNIWEPLGIKNTYFANPMNDDVKNLAKQFIVKEDGSIAPMEQSCVYQFSKAYESGGAGLISCTYDYSLLADAIASGGVGITGNRILKPETIEIIKQNLLCEDSINDLVNSMGRKGYGYGCGMSVLMDPKMIGVKAPAGIFGWDGAAGACITMDTASGISFVYVQHVRSCGMAYDTIHPMLKDLIFS